MRAQGRAVGKRAADGNTEIGRAADFSTPKGLPDSVIQSLSWRYLDWLL